MKHKKPAVRQWISAY